jgi:ribosomal protein S18 acetylase RimI-like enzyme
MRVGYIEDVSVRKGYDGLGIGSQLITHATNDAISVEGCRKILLYCSNKIADDTFVMKFDI